MRKKIFDWKPDPGQELLLRSALSESSEALNAFENWKSGNDIDDLDRGSFRLLPMVFHNLSGYIDHEGELYRKLKGAYRKSWYGNNMISVKAVSLFSELRSRGIDPILLKGIHVINSYYDTPASRPIGDADFLVPRDKAEAVGKLLESRGWRPIDNLRFHPFSSAVMNSRRSLGYISRDGFRCDLHWNILGHRCFPGADDHFVKRCENFRIKGEIFRGLCAEDLFVHILEHGAYSEFDPKIRWIPDIIGILDKTDNMDWGLVFQTIIGSNLELPVKGMLEYLNNKFDEKRILDLLNKLRSAQVSQTGKKLFEIMAPSKTEFRYKIKLFFKAYFNYRIYISEYKKLPFPHGITGIVQFLKFRWGLASNILFPFELLKRGAMKFRRYFYKKS